MLFRSRRRAAVTHRGSSLPTSLHCSSGRPKPWVSTPSHPGPLCSRCCRPWRTLGAQAPRSGELCRRLAASPPRNPLRDPHRLSRPTCALPVPRSCSRTQIRVELGPGTPLAVFSDEAPPREHIAGESRRHPVSHQVLAARSPSDDPKQTQPESTEANTGQRLAFFLKTPQFS